MYIRKTTRSYKGKKYTNYLLVESMHTPKGPRQRTVCSLGDLGPRSRSEWMKLVHKIEEALRGQDDLFESTDEEVQAIVAKVKKRSRNKQLPRGKEQGALIGVVVEEKTKSQKKLKVASTWRRSTRRDDSGWLKKVTFSWTEIFVKPACFMIPWTFEAWSEATIKSTSCVARVNP